MKKQLLLVVMLLITAASAFAVEEVKINGLWYEVVAKAKVAKVIQYKNNVYYKGNIVIPETVVYEGVTCNVTSIGNSAFFGCSGLTSITIPNSVTSIGGCAFYGCSGLTSITIPNSVTSIGTSAFSGCSGLTSITIPNSVTSIGNGVFEYCKSLASVIIPNSVTCIGENAFYGCVGLTSITIPYGVTIIGEGAFGSCTGLTSITISNSVTSIGSYAFLHCHSLTSITIPNNVTSIGSGAFSECSDLTTIITGSGIKNIYSYAFSNCPNINDVYCYAVRYPKTDKSAFDQSYPDYVTLHVPEESIEQYKNADPWSKFKAVVALKNGDPKTEDINVSGDSKCEKPSISYINGELVFSCTTNGCSFVSEIIDSDIKTHYDTRIALTATYYIKVYATKSGYENSDVATATLCWIDVDPKTEGITNGVANVSAMPVIIQNNGNVLNISGAPMGSVITVYDLSGQMVGSAKADSEMTNISISLRSGDVGIVKIGEKSVKIIIR